MGIENRMYRIFRMIRVEEWLFSKIPFMFVPLFTYIHTYGLYHGNYGLGLCLQYFIFIVTFYGFGYAINDFSDKEIDRKAGKENVMGEISPAAGVLVLGVLVTGCAPFLAMHLSVRTALLFAAVYFWGAAYSVRPFRFKERGIAGLLVSSLAQRSLPLLPLAGADARMWKGVLLWGTVGFLTGLRYILIHQYEDMENDRQTGTRTFVNARNGGIASIIGACLCLELFLVSAAGIYGRMAGYWIGLAACLALSVPVFYTVHYIYRKSYFASFLCVPLEDLYNFYLPLAWLLVFAQAQPLWAAPVAVLLLAGWGKMCRKWGMAYFGITHWRKSGNGRN
ncbi:MAG: UbiA family prenyltransferase [Lachnospiraceae bacterium]|jgi:4-hydroxybenzoate polyprenyltransferase|nr:UbiA family prenyltransferase [Lachnospiraceae bacterium]